PSPPGRRAAAPRDGHRRPTVRRGGALAGRLPAHPRRGTPARAPRRRDAGRRAGERRPPDHGAGPGVSRSVYVALVRHAPTVWNAGGRAGGRADVPLSAEGRARLAHWRLPPDLVALHRRARLGWAVSPLQRAVATAEALGADGPILEPRLAERDYGAWTGLRLAELEDALATGGWTHRPPGGEPPADVLERVRAWLGAMGARPGPPDAVAGAHL